MCSQHAARTPTGAPVVRCTVVRTIEALVLGVAQGITEFLPVSSSGHLILVRRIFGWTDSGLAFDAALHLGTLCAILFYFRRTWGDILRGREWSLLWALILGTVPGAVAGLLGRSWVNAHARSTTVVGALFLVTALLLWLADRVARRHARPDVVSRTDALVVGLFQAVALLPGLSRSGATIAAGIFQGLARPRAVEFSFLLALPITAGAALEGLRELTVQAPGEIIPALIGMVVALITGLAAIRILLRSVQTRTFRPYVVYLVLVGVVALLWR